MRMFSKKVFAIILFFMFFPLSVWAENNSISPYAVLEKAGHQLFDRIAANQQEIEKSPVLMRTIVNEELMPVIDYTYASYSILGKYLSKISIQQRADFVTSMRIYLSKTYATALLNYRHQRVIFEQEKATNDKKIISVKVQIIEESKPAIDLIFMLRHNLKTDEWKVFDLVVEGVSLLATKRAELTKSIATLGIDQVTVNLATISK